MGDTKKIESTNEEQKYHLIHRKMTPEKAVNILKRYTDTIENPWLLRESRQPGCLTVSFVAINSKTQKRSVFHTRYAYGVSGTPEWGCVSTQELAKKVNSIIPINLVNDGIMKAVKNLSELLEQRGFDINDKKCFPL